MERYDNTLAKFIEENQHLADGELDRLYHIIDPLINAIRHIHDKGYIHMDLKPENILLKFSLVDGPIKVVLADFGLTRKKRDEDTNTRRIGTPPYNQCPGEFITEKCDMWALGLVIYFLVEGIRSRNRVLVQELSIVGRTFTERKAVDENVENTLRNMGSDHRANIYFCMLGGLTTAQLCDVIHYSSPHIVFNPLNYVISSRCRHRCRCRYVLKYVRIRLASSTKKLISMSANNSVAPYEYWGPYEYCLLARVAPQIKINWKNFYIH